jgi:hypothetical protein
MSLSACSLTLKEEHRLNVLRKIFELNWDVITVVWRGLQTSRSFVICSSYRLLFGWSNQEEWTGGACGTYRGRGEFCTGFWWGEQRERYQVKN